MRVHGLLVDPQNTFCDGPAQDGLGAGELAVPGGWAAMDRLAAFVERAGDRFESFHVTLDSHHQYDIAHPAFWMDEDGRPPAPFTPISAAEVEAGIWRTRDPELRGHGIRYCHKLEERGCYTLMIWPPHALIGTPGHNVQPRLSAALRAWETRWLTLVDYHIKGINPLTEHYSAIAAEIPIPGDSGTMVNTELLNAIREADVIVIAGLALSHCVRFTVADVAEDLGSDKIGRFVLLRDCTASVPGFEAEGEAFVRAMQAQGMRVMTSDTFQP